MTARSRHPLSLLSLARPAALIHHVTITGLAPSTVYFYRCGSPTSGYSETFNFTSPPAVGPNAE